MSRRINHAGLVVAGTGFFLTRFTVTLAIGDPLRFYLAGVVPLLLGLGLDALGYEHVVPLLDRASGRGDADGPST